MINRKEDFVIREEFSIREKMYLEDLLSSSHPKMACPKNCGWILSLQHGGNSRLKGGMIRCPRCGWEGRNPLVSDEELQDLYGTKPIPPLTVASKPPPPEATMWEIPCPRCKKMFNVPKNDKRPDYTIMCNCGLVTSERALIKTAVSAKQVFMHRDVG